MGTLADRRRAMWSGLGCRGGSCIWSITIASIVLHGAKLSVAEDVMLKDITDDRVASAAVVGGQDSNYADRVGDSRDYDPVGYTKVPGFALKSASNRTAKISIAECKTRCDNSA